jgi:hypothetical protein
MTGGSSGSSQLKEHQLPTKAIKSHSLSILLLKEDVRPSEVIKSNLGRIEVKGVGELYFKQNARTPPKWLTFFGDTLSEVPRLHNQSSGALLLVKRGRRHFALTFGLGRHLLEPGRSEESFGLRVTLNSVDPARLRSVDRRTFDAISSHTPHASEPRRRRHCIQPKRRAGSPACGHWITHQSTTREADDGNGLSACDAPN